MEKKKEIITDENGNPVDIGTSGRFYRNEKGELIIEERSREDHLSYLEDPAKFHEHGRVIKRESI